MSKSPHKLKKLEAVPNKTKESKESKKTKEIKLNVDEIDISDVEVVLDAEISAKGLVSHHTDSFNSFTSLGIKQIVTELFQVEKTFQNKRTSSALDKEISHINILVRFSDIQVGKPIYFKRQSGAKDDLLPRIARSNNLNYSSPLAIDAIITAKAYFKDAKRAPLERVETIQGYNLAGMPIMTGCTECHTSKMTTAQARMENEEDPYEKGGVFIFRGGEWVISIQETRLFNQEHVFHNVGHEKEKARLEFLSKPGDAYENSSELIIRYVNDGNILITLTSHKYFKKAEIPFYIIFRLFGMTIDKEIFDNIIYGYNDIDDPEGKKYDVVSQYMLQILKKAFTTTNAKFDKMRNITDQGRLVEAFSQYISIFNKDSMSSSGSHDMEAFTRSINSKILNLLDKYLLPHIGLDASKRYDKLRYLGHLIHKMLLVERDIVPSTDRDALDQKRMNPAGRGFAKSFKQQFHKSIVKPVSRNFEAQFKNLSFDSVPLAQTFKNGVQNVNLERSMITAIVAGSKESALKAREQHSRLASEVLHRKNQLNVLSTLRVIRTPSTSSSKQDQRADEMRRAHPSYSRFICPVQSADTGEQVGMVKQLALGASISDASDSTLLKKLLLEDKDIIPLDRVFPKQIHDHALTKILVNGDWIGCCRNAAAIIRKYTESRRGYTLVNEKDINILEMPSPLEFFAKAKFRHGRDPLIDRVSSIVWNVDSNDIRFWVDAGRLLAPVLIVRNNGELDPIGREHFKSAYDPYTNKGFVQDILLTQDMIKALRRGEMTIHDLVEQGVVEYMSPDEMKRCYLASSVEALRANSRNPLRQFTHCDIPQGLLGLAALTSPYADHNQAPRNTFQTNQVKQTCGIYTWAFPFRTDKNSFVQFNIEVPLISTLANKYIYPNGMNTTVAIACYGGHNQEDSLIINESAAQRCLFKGLHYNFIKSELLVKEEHFGHPNEANTTDIKRHANYEHLHGDTVTERTILHKNDVVVAKYVELPRPVDGKTRRDISVTYPYNEPAMVEKVISAYGHDGIQIRKVKFSSVRTLGLGDKFSSRHGQKGETGMAYNQADMLFSEDGSVPALIMSPQAIPSRMTIGQPIEGLAAKIAAILGAISDATVFKKMDIEAMGDLLEKLGCHRHGTERMYNGMTGEWVDVRIFNTPTYYQRLQKFVVDDVYSISTGPTSATTRQPLEGKANQGGLRIGEMEKDVILSHGAGHFLMEKFRDDSDGFDIYLCRTCRGRPIVNEELPWVECKRCEANRTIPDVVKVRSTWASKLFLQELESCNVGINTSVRPYEYEV